MIGCGIIYQIKHLVPTARRRYVGLVIIATKIYFSKKTLKNEKYIIIEFTKTHEVIKLSIYNSFSFNKNIRKTLQLIVLTDYKDLSEYHLLLV